MQALSDAARAAIQAGTYGLRPLVDLYRGAEQLRLDVPLRSDDPGSVNVDVTAAVLRSCTLNFAPDVGDEILPLLPLVGGPLEPTGVEAFVYSELLLPDGTVETIPQGVFGIRAPTATDNGAATVVATGRDRSQRVIDATLTAPYDIPPGVNIATAIHDLIDAGVPGLTYVGFDEGSTRYSTTSALHFPDGDNRWQRGADMAASAGKELRFTTLGQVQLRPVPDVTFDAAVWSFIDGEDNLAGEIVQGLNADQTFSHAAVLSQPLDGSPPLRADAYDDDPLSPTYWRGPFGDRVVRESSSYIGTQDQANDAAQALLRRKRGVLETVTMTVAPIVAFEEYDVLYARRESLGLDSYYQLTAFPIPLGPNTMTLTSTARRVR